MKLILIRHSNPDYSGILENNNTFLPTMAPLSQEGRLLAYDTFKLNLDILKEGKIILSSNFERAVETANILNEFLLKDLFIEEDLHEWLPDKEFKHKISEIHNFYKDYKSKNGIKSNNEPWEENSEVKKRVIKCLYKYKEYETIIIVAHSRLFKILFDIKEINYCSIHEINFSLEDFINEENNF